MERIRKGLLIAIAEIPLLLLFLPKNKGAIAAEICFLVLFGILFYRKSMFCMKSILYIKSMMPVTAAITMAASVITSRINAAAPRCSLRRSLPRSV